MRSTTTAMAVAVWVLCALQTGARAVPVEVDIYDVQYTTDPSGDSPYLGQEVTISGVVSSACTDGYTVMQNPGPWESVFVYSFRDGPDVGDAREDAVGIRVAAVLLGQGAGRLQHGELALRFVVDDQRAELFQKPVQLRHDGRDAAPAQAQVMPDGRARLGRLNEGFCLRPVALRIGAEVARADQPQMVLQTGDPGLLPAQPVDAGGKGAILWPYKSPGPQDRRTHRLPQGNRVSR